MASGRGRASPLSCWFRRVRLGTEAWGATCDTPETDLQKIELRVTAEDGRIVEEVEVIIGG